MTPPQPATALEAVDDLPEGVIRALTTRFGRLLAFTHVKQRPDAGAWSMVVDTETSGRVFVRAAAGGSGGAARAAVESLRREALVAHVVSGMTPPLLARYSTSGWHMLVFGHVPGRRADLRPGSPDLAPVTAELRWIARTWTDTGVPPLSQRWRGDDPHVGRPPFGGDMLLHPDLAANLRLHRTVTRGRVESRVWVLNWENAVTGPAWAQFALMYPALRRAGHSKVEALAWLAQLDPWRHVPPERVRSLAGALLACARAEEAPYWDELLAD